MKTGKSISDLAKEIERQASAKVDLVARTSVVAMRSQEDGSLKLHVGDDEKNRFGVNEIAHDQIGAHLEIPSKYYDRMRTTDQRLLCTNVNAWFARMPEEKRMIRTLDGTARAFMSDKYRPLDYTDLLEAILPPLIHSGAEIVSCDVTDRKLYIKAVDKKVQRQIEEKTGHRIGDGSHAFFKDTLCPAITISNSEVGCGALNVRSSVYKEGCTNFMILKESSVRKQHVGSRHDLGDELMSVLSDRTRKLKDAALWSEVGDVVKGAFDLAKFDARVAQLTGLTKQAITGDPVEVITLTRRHFGMSDDEGTSVMRHLINGGDLSRYGLLNAITRAAQDIDSYDRATEFERFGGDVLELDSREWKRIAEAA